jgi:hypothetical protein
MTGLASNTLKFQINKKDVNQMQVIDQSSAVKVSHSEKFFNAPNNSLRPDFKSILEEGICTDIVLLVREGPKGSSQGVIKKVNANKCILASRSTYFSQLIG